jgi:hypothetical protein
MKIDKIEWNSMEFEGIIVDVLDKQLSKVLGSR